jgi:hypothetical protein
MFHGLGNQHPLDANAPRPKDCFLDPHLPPKGSSHTSGMLGEGEVIERYIRKINLNFVFNRGIFLSNEAR